MEISVMPHLVADITGHGFGHVAQTAPVLNALRDRFSSMRLTVRTPAVPAILTERIRGPFHHIQSPDDLGLFMLDPVTVDVAKTASFYRELCRTWDDRVAAEAEKLAALRPDLLLANISPLSLAAAKRAGVPSVAYGSLNWLDTLAAYCPEETEVLQTLKAGYRSATHVLQPRPCLPPSWADKPKTVGPVVDVGMKRRDDLAAKLGAGLKDRIVFASLGGIKEGAPPPLPEMDNVVWLTAGTIDGLGMSHPDIVRSCDAVVCKTGYGTFTEAACNGARILYGARPDFPEAKYLEAWIEIHACAEAISLDALKSGNFARQLADLLDRPKRPPVAATEAEEAAAILAEMLEHG